ncbi:MAG: hypothetical protein ABIX44_03340, partial [Cryobacterium sp.]
MNDDEVNGGAEQTDAPHDRRSATAVGHRARRRLVASAVGVALCALLASVAVLAGAVTGGAPSTRSGGTLPEALATNATSVPTVAATPRA